MMEGSEDEMDLPCREKRVIITRVLGRYVQISLYRFKTYNKMSGIVDPANFQCSDQFLDGGGTFEPIKDQNMAGRMGKIEQYFLESRNFDREFVNDNRIFSMKFKSKKNRVSINSSEQIEGIFPPKTETKKLNVIKVSTDSPEKINDNFEIMKSPVKIVDNFHPKHQSPLKSSNDDLRKELLQKLSTPNKSARANLLFITSTPTKESASSPSREIMESSSDEDSSEEETNDDVFGSKLSNISNSDLAEIAEVSKNFKHIMKDLDHVNIRTESERELLGIRVDELGGVIRNLQKELEIWKSEMDEYKLENEELLAENSRLRKDHFNQKVKNGVLEKMLKEKEEEIRQQMINLSSKEEENRKEKAENEKMKSKLVASAVVVVAGLAFLMGKEIQLFSF